MPGPKRSPPSNLTTVLVFTLVAIVFGGGTWLFLELSKRSAAPPTPGAAVKLVVGAGVKPVTTVRLKVVNPEGAGVPDVDVTLAGVLVGKTNAGGVVQVSREAKEGALLEFGVAAPSAYGPPTPAATSALSLRATYGGRTAVSREIVVQLTSPPGPP